MKKPLLGFAAFCLTTTAHAGGGHLFPGVIGPGGGGTGVSTQTTAGAVIFGGANGIYASRPDQFFWDNTNNRIGIGTSSPQTAFQTLGTSSSRAIMVNSPDPVFAASANTSAEIALFGTAYSGSNSSMLDLLAYSTSSANPLYRITNHWEGTSSSGTIAIGNYVGSTFTDVLAITTQTRVGVGTINPLSTFDVKGSAAFGTYGGANAAPSNGLVVSGSVGIGIAGPATKLHMSSGTLTIDGNTNNMLDLLGASALLGIRTANPAQAFHLSSGTILIDGNATNALTISGTGRVGIGITNPSMILHSYIASSGVTCYTGSSGCFESNTHGYINIIGPDSSEKGIAFGRATGGAIDGGIIYDTASGASRGFSFRTASTANQMVLTSGGFLSVGAGSTPTAKLHLSSGTLTIDGTSPTVKVGTMTISGTAPPNGTALCLNAGTLGYCSTTPTNGACTCNTP